MSQAVFLSALMAPEAPVPAGLIGPKGRPAGKRFDVYRNNVVVSLSEALAEAFPAIVKLVGEEFFTALAGQFVRANPPRDPRIATWGGSFPDYIAGFPPLAHLPYLPDVARLEQALRESYHAADAAPARPEDLAALSAQSRLIFAPALRLVTSPHPVHAIWAFSRGNGPKPQAGAQSVLVARPAWDPQPTLLAPGGGAFVSALIDGETLGAALDAAPEGFDMTSTLAALISGGAITGLDPQP